MLIYLRKAQPSAEEWSFIWTTSQSYINLFHSEAEPALSEIHFVLFVYVIYLAAKPIFTRYSIKHVTIGLFPKIVNF